MQKLLVPADSAPESLVSSIVNSLLCFEQTIRSAPAGPKEDGPCEFPAFAAVSTRMTASARVLINMLTFLDEPQFRGRELVPGTSPENVQRRQQNETECQLYDEAANNHNGKRALRV